jgi:hypothetical protein
VLQGECGQSCVGHKRSRDLCFKYLILQKVPEPLTCADQVDVDQIVYANGVNTV